LIHHGTEEHALQYALYRDNTERCQP